MIYNSFHIATTFSEPFKFPSSLSFDSADMASDEIMNIVHSSMLEDDEDDHHHHSQSLSRLSICTANSSKHSLYDADDDEDMSMFMSRLSLEVSDSDADDDEEFSDDKEGKGVSDEESDSDKDSCCLSVPLTPSSQSTNSRRGIVRERWLERVWEKKKCRNMDEENFQSGLSIDLEEVKGCKDLGFELEEEQERMLEIPTQISMSCSTIDTSSGGNSPIPTWRISSPGDDPRDVKARLKVWAQAVALVSATHYVG